ncbi:MAG TPA: hypothetical protein VNZ26_14600 [Vicinamibacterales bacterium]|jgi:hypothetical protein|nr:hypothetical protein [Vicinamibacterales bacterium]
MSNPAGTRFDESLASVARELHVGEVALTAVAAALLLYLWLERRGRPNWHGVALLSSANAGHPYRSRTFAVAPAGKAPRLVRGAALASLVFGLLFVPLVALAVVRYPFDGISIPLLPGMALALLNWASAWLLLARARLAGSAARSGAVGSLIANVGLLAIAGVHFVEVEMQRRDGIEHACSSSVTFVVMVFAVASVAQALVVLAALRAHGGALLFTPPPSPLRPSA